MQWKMKNVSSFFVAHRFATQGLDTASSVDILRILSYVTYTFGRVSLVSLLQPSPEAVSLFDEVILLDDGGRVIFAGPTEDATDYFRRMGYVQPDSMDNADYLLAVASPDRKYLYKGPNDPHSPASLALFFAESEHGRKIRDDQGRGRTTGRHVGARWTLWRAFGGVPEFVRDFDAVEPQSGLHAVDARPGVHPRERHQERRDGPLT